MNTSISNISDYALEREYNRRFSIKSGERISSVVCAFKHLKQFFIRGSDKERFVIIYLNGNNKVIKTEQVFEGSITTCAVYPREVVKRVIEYGAAAIILAHNHPSGNLNPSLDDKVITEKLKNACATIDVQVHDHIILADNKFVSFADDGLL